MMAEQLAARNDPDSPERILVPLVDAFPTGATAKRVQIYADEIRTEGFTPDDLREGVSRVIHVWNDTKFPPFARLKACCKDARSLRLTVERNEAKEREDKRVFRKLPQDTLDAQLAEIRQFRLKTWPKRTPDIQTDREARLKHLGIVPLTQDQNDEFNRNRRERERARHAEG